MENVKARDEQLRKSSSLEELLRINSSSPSVVYKFDPEGGPREEVRISELNDKLVGLYVPGKSGDLFPTLVDIYAECMEKQLEFEIVVAYSQDSYEIDLKLYQEKIDRLFLEKHDICKRWWCLPLDNYVSLRLNRVIGRGWSSSDMMCVVGPGGGFIDLHAPRVVMEKYGVDGYPFTREAIIQKEVLKMREVTVGSVLLGDDIFRGFDHDDVISARKLSGKKICVYLGSIYYMWDYKKIFSSYREMKAVDPGFEVVFVYPKNNSVDVELHNQCINAMPWYVCPFDLARLESVKERIGISYDAIVGFGKDGRVRSCQSAEWATFTLDDTLYEDVFEIHRHELPSS